MARVQVEFVKGDYAPVYDLVKPIEYTDGWVEIHYREGDYTEWIDKIPVKEIHLIRTEVKQEGQNEEEL
jgi:hypothetical protein